MDPTANLDGLAVHVWITDESDQAVGGAEVAMVLGETSLTARTGADGFGVAVAWGDPFVEWPGWTEAQVTDITQPDYRLHRLSLQSNFPGNFWFPTGCCETQPGAADYGVRHTTWCPAPGLVRIAVRDGADRPVGWRDAGSIEPVVPQMGFLDWDGTRWLKLPLGLLVDAGAMKPCP